MFSIFSIRSQYENGQREELAHVNKKLLDHLERVAMKILKNEHDAEDAAMQALLLIGENAPKLADLTADEFLAVSITYTRNVAKAIYKKRKLDRDMLVEYSDEICGKAEEPEAEDTLFCEENISLMTALLDQLPEIMQDVLHFRYYMNMKYAEIASLMGITEGAARVYCHRAKKLLKKQMEKEGYHGQKWKTPQAIGGLFG